MYLGLYSTRKRLHLFPCLTMINLARGYFNVITVMSLNPTRECWICSYFLVEIGFLNLQFYKRQLSILMESEQESKYCWDHIWKNSLKFMFHKRVSKGFGGVRGETFRRINTKDGITNQENHQNWKNYGHNSMSVMT